MIQIELFGKPVPWAAPKFSEQRAYSPRAQEKLLAMWQIKAQYREAIIKGPVFLEFTFFIPIPKTTSGVRKKQMLAGIILPVNKPDTTNMQKFYEDCLKGIVIEDDNRCTDIYSKKRYSENPGVLIRVYNLEHTRPNINIFQVS